MSGKWGDKTVGLFGLTRTVLPIRPMKKNVANMLAYTILFTVTVFAGKLRDCGHVLCLRMSSVPVCSLFTTKVMLANYIDYCLTLPPHPPARLSVTITSHHSPKQSRLRLQGFIPLHTAI